MRFRRLALTLALLVPLVAFAAEPAVNAAYDTWAGGFATEWFRFQPPSQAEPGGAPATNATGASNEAPEANFEPALQREERRVALARKGLAELGQFAPDTLAPPQRTSAALIRWTLELAVAGAPFTEHQFVFRQFNGLHVTIANQLTEGAPLRTQSGVDAFLRQLPVNVRRIDDGISRARAAAKRGLIPPRFILERSREQVVMFLAPEPAQHSIVLALTRRLAESDLKPEARTAALEKTTQIVGDQLKPAYARVRDLLDELLPQSTNDAGISHLPDGPAAYAHALRTYTTTTMTAEEIHALGLREVARVEREMDRVLRELGHTEGTVAQRYARAALGEPVPAGPDARAAMIARYTAIIRDAEKRCAPLFNLKPRAPVEVRREPPLTERTAAAHYTRPGMGRGGPRGGGGGERGEGRRDEGGNAPPSPGIFWVPLPGPNFFYSAGMRTLAYHEAVPGHHFQLAIQGELPNQNGGRGRGPGQSRARFGGNSAFTEGWGLYAERLAVEQGWYEGDAFGKLGALQGELFRAKRLVVDSGLHAKGWTRQQAIAYGISAQEVERYVVWPGQACAYMVGMLRILDVREKARVALGEKFSLPAFHDVVLKTGAVPLDVLSDVVADWVAAERARTATRTE